MGLVAFLLRSLLRLLSASHRTRPAAGDWTSFDTLAGAGEPLLLAVWHNQTLLALAPLRRLVDRGLTPTLMVSRSRDGELAARVIGPWGARVHRGSASRGGQAAIRALYRDLRRHRSSPVLMPDGPRGPLYQVKPGVVVLAQLSGAPIVPLAFAADRAWRLRSWDRLIVPRPFARLAVAVGAPLGVPRELGAGGPAPFQRRLEDELHRLTAAATESLRRPPKLGTG